MSLPLVVVAVVKVAATTVAAPDVTTSTLPPERAGLVVVTGEVRRVEVTVDVPVAAGEGIVDGGGGGVDNEQGGEARELEEAAVFIEDRCLLDEDKPKSGSRSGGRDRRR